MYAFECTSPGPDFVVIANSMSEALTTAAKHLGDSGIGSLTVKQIRGPVVFAPSVETELEVAALTK